MDAVLWLAVCSARSVLDWCGTPVAPWPSSMTENRRCQIPQGSVLVGVDGSSASELATEIAFDEASRRRVGLIALHAWSNKELIEVPGVDWPAVKAEEERLMSDALAAWQERYPDVTVQKLLVCDRPARALVETSNPHSLSSSGVTAGMP